MSTLSRTRKKQVERKNKIRGRGSFWAIYVWGSNYSKIINPKMRYERRHFARRTRISSQNSPSASRSRVTGTFRQGWNDNETKKSLRGLMKPVIEVRKMTRRLCFLMSEKNQVENLVGSLRKCNISIMLIMKWAIDDTCFLRQLVIQSL